MGGGIVTFQMGDLGGTVRVATQQKKAPPECANTRGAGTYQSRPGGTVMEPTLPLSTAEHPPSSQNRQGLLQPLHISECIAEIIRDLAQRVEDA